MHTETQILMLAPPAAIYPIAAAVERWPELLPHYRYVRIIEDRGSARLVEMGAQRDGIPVRWSAEQTLYPGQPTIRFKHVRGVTTGMEVAWRFEPVEGGTLVSIEHQLTPTWPLGGLVADLVIGPFFIENIAGKTLRRIKQLVEQPQALTLRPG